MGDSLMTVVAIFVAVLLMFLFPMLSVPLFWRSVISYGIVFVFDELDTILKLK